MSKPENPPAFPAPLDDSHYYGLTMRDYFAGQALVPLIPIYVTESSAGVDVTLSRMAYMIADSMLLERSKS